VRGAAYRGLTCVESPQDWGGGDTVAGRWELLPPIQSRSRHCRSRPNVLEVRAQWTWTSKYSLSRNRLARVFVYNCWHYGGRTSPAGGAWTPFFCGPENETARPSRSTSPSTKNDLPSSILNAEQKVRYPRHSTKLPGERTHETKVHRGKQRQYNVQISVCEPSELLMPSSGRLTGQPHRRQYLKRSKASGKHEISRIQRKSARVGKRQNEKGGLQSRVTHTLRPKYSHGIGDHMALAHKV
jgi:hypothetical protein